MPQYRAHIQDGLSGSVTFESDLVLSDPPTADEMEALAQEAYEAEWPTLCAQCSGWGRQFSASLDDEMLISESETTHLYDIELIKE